MELPIHAHPLSRQDSSILLHPYANPIDTYPALPVSHTDGCKIFLSDGQGLVDAMASWWSVIHGYNHPALTQAAKEQIDSMPHVMFGGLTHAPAVKLAQKLLSYVPYMSKVFFADSGSVAVEVALKMALQCGLAQSRNKILTVRGGYHGDTLNAMSVCDPINGMHSYFQGILTQQIFAPKPNLTNDTGDIDAFERLIRENHDCIAAVILEPILQGASGMRHYRPAYLSAVRALCSQYDILLIADEIATGFGRTGTLFACEHANIEPDILCVGKALTGGFMSLAATLCTQQVAEKIAATAPSVIMHGPTFMANPLACAVAHASLTLLDSGEWSQQVRHIEQHFNKHLMPLKNCEEVADVRVIGAVGVVELTYPLSPEDYTPLLLEHGVWLRPFGKLLYSMPPYNISSEELSKITAAMCAIVLMCSA